MTVYDETEQKAERKRDNDQNQILQLRTFSFTQKRNRLCGSIVTDRLQKEKRRGALSLFVILCYRGFRCVLLDALDSVVATVDLFVAFRMGDVLSVSG